MNAARPLIAIGIASLAVGAVVAFIPRQFGADKHADPVTHQCEQTESVTCGPAAVVSALSWVGIDTTERAEVIACHTHSTGTDLADIASRLHGVVQSMPASAPGRTFVVQIDDTAPHAVCAHGEADGWTVNDPSHVAPEHWTAKDFGNAVGAVEVKP